MNRRLLRIILMVIMAAPAGMAASEVWAEEPDWRSIEAAARSFSRQTERRAKRSPLITSTAKVARRAGAKKPRQVFDWMRDNIAFEAYGGALRGARGTLIAEAGNSVDQAILASEILKEGGHTVRFVRGRAFERDAADLIRQFAGEASIVSPAAVASGKDFPAADLTDDIRFVGVVTDHVWLEVKWNDKWVPFDPVLAPTYGVAKAKPRTTSAEIFDDLAGTMRVAVKSSFQDDQERTLATLEADLAELAYDHISLTFVPDRGRPDRFHAALSLGSRTVVSPESMPRKQVRELEIEVNLKRGRLQTRFTETLIADSNVDSVFGYDQQAFDISLFPGWTTPEAAAYFGDLAVSEASGDIREYARAARKGESVDVTRASNRAHRDLGFVLATAFSSRVDRIARELAYTMGVEPVFGEPRIVTTAILRRGAEYDYRMNVRGEGLTAIPKKGIPLASAYGFLSMMGHILHELEGELLGELAGEKVMTVKAFFDAAMKQRIALKTIDSGNVSRLKRMGLEGSSQAAVRERVTRKGDMALMTTREIDFGDQNVRAWWLLNPESGHISGSLGEAMFSTDTRPEANESGAAAAIGTLALTKRLRDAIDRSTSDSNSNQMVCKAMNDLQRLGRAFCATKKALSLPSARSCAEKSSEGADLEEQLLRRASCEDRTEAFRCGVSMSKALLTGELTALYTDRDIMKKGELKKAKAKSRRATGLTCAP